MRGSGSRMPISPCKKAALPKCGKHRSEPHWIHGKYPCSCHKDLWSAIEFLFNFKIETAERLLSRFCLIKILISEGKKMKKLFCLLLSVLLIAGFTACGGKTDTVADLDAIKAAGVLRVGMECDYTPFNWTQTEESARTVAINGGGYADGYDVQIAKAIADGLGVKLEIVKTEWGGLTSSLQANMIDAIIAGMSPTAERKATIDFSDNYYNSDLVIVVKKDSPFAAATKLADFSGAKITGQLSTFHYTVIDQIEGVDKQTAMETFPAMIVALRSGVIDGYISERPGAISAVTGNPDLSYVAFAEGSGFTASEEDTAIAVGLRKNSDLAAEINKILSGITAEQRLTLMEEAVANQPLSAE